MTGAGATAKTKPHSHKLQQRGHTMTTARTRAAKSKAKQSKNANMIDANEAHTPQRAKGTNETTPTAGGAIVTPLAAKRNTATTGQDRGRGE